MYKMSEIFGALSDETRLRIMSLFLYSDQALCVCELVDVLELPQYQVSRHLAALKNGGLLSVSKKGTWAYHRVNTGDPRVQAVCDFLRATPLDDPDREHRDREDRDRQALGLRLALREDGMCVVGLRSDHESSTDSHRYDRSRK